MYGLESNQIGGYTQPNQRENYLEKVSRVWGPIFQRGARVLNTGINKISDPLTDKINEFQQSEMGQAANTLLEAATPGASLAFRGIDAAIDKFDLPQEAALLPLLGMLKTGKTPTKSQLKVLSKFNKPSVSSKSLLNKSSNQLSKAEYRALAKKMHVEQGIPTTEITKKLGYWIDPVNKHRFSVQSKHKKNIELKDLELRKNRNVRRVSTQKPDESTILKQFGGDKTLSNSYIKTNKKVISEIRERIKKLNNANKNNPNWMDWQIEHVVDAQHFNRLSKKVPNFSGRGSDELLNLTLIRKRENARTGAKAMKIDPGSAFIKAEQSGKLLDYNKAASEFMDFDMGGTVKKMTPKDWDLFFKLATENPTETFHDLLKQF